MAVTVAFAACYPSAGEGVDPPKFKFYFPTGLAVSRGGNVLYVANSDFDLQWNGGTIQSLDLHLIRRHTVMCIQDPANPNLPVAAPPTPNTKCPSGPPIVTTLLDGGVNLGWVCAPPTNASFYMRDSVAIGAFATDLQLSRVNRPCPSPSTPCSRVSRLFTPVRGDASLTWADIADDDSAQAPLISDTAATYAPFKLDCGTRDSRSRCDTIHRTGNNINQPGDTRQVMMPGEPFAMAQSDDGQAIVITHQGTFCPNPGSNPALPCAPASTLFSAFTPGASLPSDPNVLVPAIQFVATVPETDDMGVASIPHSPDAYPECFPDPTSSACVGVMPRPAFLETSRSTALVGLVRYYDNQGDAPSGPFRPFIQNEANYPLNVGAGTTDFARGVAIDPSPRIRCKATITVAPSDPTYPAQLEACARIPARVFIASRGPAALIVGEVGEPIAQDGSFAADQVTFTDSVPLPLGPSAVHLAPVVDNAGNLALRVFIVCFDANQIIDYDPDQKIIEAVIQVGLGPFAVAFDHFDYDDAALGKPVAIDPRNTDLGIKTYRFAYVASFTNSYVQVVDLDNSTAEKTTWASVVYTVGVPQLPAGGN